MDSDDKLPLELVWHEDGHLTEVALSALADGEAAILPEEAAVHADCCEACARALGEAALLTLRAGEALRDAAASVAVTAPVTAAASVAVTAPAPVTAAAPVVARPLPLAAVAAALAIAALAAAPRLIARGPELSEDVQALGRTLLVMAGVGRALVQSGAFARGWMSVLPWVSAALLVVIGLGVARAARGQVSAEEGGRG